MLSSEKSDPLQTNFPQFKDFEDSNENILMNDLKNAKFSKVNIEIEGNLSHFENISKAQLN